MGRLACRVVVRRISNHFHKTFDALTSLTQFEISRRRRGEPPVCAKSLEELEFNMSITTIFIIVALVLLFGGGGFYYSRGRR